MSLRALATSLHEEATRANERRLLVLAGDADATFDAAREALDAAAIDGPGVTAVTSRHLADWETIAPAHAGDLLGTTRAAVVLDAHEGFSPNVLGRTVGAVDGGGLFVLLAPSLDEWPDTATDFDERLAVPPFGLDDVAGNFRRRLVKTLRAHHGVAVVDVGEDGDSTIETDGLTDPPEAPSKSRPSAPADRRFPTAAYEACVTGDQVRAVHALEALADPGAAVVVEADRGRGKSSAAGLAAGALAAEGKDVLVTAPSFRAARTGFRRAAELMGSLGALADRTSLDEADESADIDSADPPQRLDAEGGGTVRYRAVDAAVDLPDDPDAVIVDEAAAFPVRRLEEFLDAPSVAFCTTVHGYEGAGRGFDVRFRDRLAETDVSLLDVTLDEPIRYAAGDPVEAWAFRALMLDARPAVEPAVADATPETVDYRAVQPAELLANEHLLREAFGLLVLAHYRTEPDDLARLLDAPNLDLRVLTHEGHVVSVALLAREGGLSADRRAAMYEGSRVRGNMLPDVLTSQLRDEAAAEPVGYRVMRIATHHAVRDSGLGSRLLACVEAEARGERGVRGPALGEDLDSADWLGVGYGATEDLVRFWTANGYRSIHLSTTRNDESGEYSAIMLRPLTETGEDLSARTARRFRNRVAGLLADPLRDADPDVVGAVLRSIDAAPALDLSEYEWRVAAGAAYGPGLSDVAPGVFSDLALSAFLVSGAAESDADDPLTTLDDRAERTLVRKCLQAHRWDAVASELDFVSTSGCMRTFGETLQPLVAVFGGDVARAERRRFSEE